jgi:plastocyanin
MKSKLLVLAAAAGLAAVTVPAGAASKPATARLQASDFRFCAASAPACSPNDNGSITVKVGTRVTWTYTDHACDAVVPCPGHNVVFANGRGATKFVKTQGAVIFSGVFTHPGKFAYWCTAHKSFGMTGTVVVKR